MGASDRTTHVLENEHLAWHLEQAGGRLRSARLDNLCSGSTLAIADPSELALTFSSAVDRVAEPYARADDFLVQSIERPDAAHALFGLCSPGTGIEAVLHYAIEGPTRRKWAEVENRTRQEVLLLDVELDDFWCEAVVTGGGQGEPLFLGGEAFAAVEHPAGWSEGATGRARLGHHPGRRLAPGERWVSHTALVSVCPAGEALSHFVSYIRERSVRPKKMLSVYTPFGINNQWGGCPTLDDEQTLDVLDLLAEWQRKGIRFDYFTLDTGWVDPSSDLKRFRPIAYPNGPAEVIERIGALGMKLGLWFATSWAAESCWDHPPAWERQEHPPMAYRNGYPDKAGYGGMLCFATDAYAAMLRDAVLHHVRENGARFLKFDGGHYRCDSNEHGHLPGRYSTEAMYETLIGIAEAARAEAPDVFVMWYWGLRSPFWALHGDMIFESGLHMEGSGTSSFPTLYYRDSVTLAQDQNAYHAERVPPVVKDSLGMWLSDTRWGNYMGKERWREALVMDLGRGNLLFPNLWGNLYHLTDEDVAFLAGMLRFAEERQALLLRPRRSIGDPFANEVYGYAYFAGDHGVLFLNNVHFSARKVVLRLDESLGVEAAPGKTLTLVSRFPEAEQVLPADGRCCHAGDAVEVWLRPFEVLLLEVKPSDQGTACWPARSFTESDATAYGASLALREAPPAPQDEVRFAEAARFEGLGFARKVYAFEMELPQLEGETPILAVPVRLRRGGAEWRYSPVVAEIVQVTARIGDDRVQLIPVPDARQFGNTQKAGCSWVLYKVRLNPDWSGRKVCLAVHAYLAPDVEAHTDAWVVRRWWRENTRPVGDGYYADAPS